MMAASPLRQRVLELLGENPKGLATAVLVEHLGVPGRHVVSLLGRMARTGLAHCTAGTTPGSVWTRVVDAPPPRKAETRRGAAEVAAARARSAMVLGNPCSLGELAPGR